MELTYRKQYLMAIRKNHTIPQLNTYNSTFRYIRFKYPPTKLFGSLSGVCILSTFLKIDSSQDISKILGKHFLEIALNQGVFKRGCELSKTNSMVMSLNKVRVYCMVSRYLSSVGGVGGGGWWLYKEIKLALQIQL